VPRVSLFNVAEPDPRMRLSRRAALRRSRSGSCHKSPSDHSGPSPHARCSPAKRACARASRMKPP